MTSTLYAPASLASEESLNSDNGEYYLTMQSDGNLVMYNSSDGKAIWATNTNGAGVERADLQDDGNFVLYRSDDQPVWATQTSGQGPSCRLVLQDDRNLVLYNSAGAAIWASNTA